MSRISSGLKDGENGRHGVSLRSQGFWVVVGDGITVLATIGVAAALARTISPPDMATFKQITYLGMMVVALTELGLSNSIYRYYQVFRDQRRRQFLRQIMVTSLIAGLLGTVGIYSGAGAVSGAYHNPPLKQALQTICAYPLVSLPYMFVRPILIARGYSLKATLWETLFAITTSAGLLLPLRNGWTLNSALVLWMLCQSGQLALVVVILRPELRGERASWDWSVTREVWGYVWPLHVSRIPGLAMVYFDKVVASVFLSPGLFAAYALGARELPFLNRVSASLSSVLIPRLVEAFQASRLDRVCDYWRAASLSTALATYPVAAFCIWYAKPIMRVLYTDVYEESAIPFAAYGAITFIRVVEYGSLAKAMGNNHIIMRGAGLAASVSIPLSIGFTWLFGIWGICLSLLASALLMVVYYLVVYSRLLQKPISEVLPVWKLSGILCLSFLCVGAIDMVTGSWLDVRGQEHTLTLMVHLGVILFMVSGTYVTLLFLVRHFKPSVFAGLMINASRRRIR